MIHRFPDQKGTVMTQDTSDVTRRNFFAASASVAGAAFVGTIGFNRLAQAEDGDTSEMITQLAQFKIKPDNEDEAVAGLQELCKGVEENEPGVLAYICHRSQDNPEEVVFFEVYKDKDALSAHGKTPHIRKMFGSFAKLFSGPVKITKLDRVGGFAR